MSILFVLERQPPMIKSHRLKDAFSVSLCVSIFLVIYILIKQTRIDFEICPSSRPVNVSVSHLSNRSSSSPYLAFIVSAAPERSNFTKSALNARLPDYFIITHRKSVEKTDPRIYTHVGLGAASLMLTYIDLWKDIALKSHSELTENDWVFVFEDDVDIVPLGMLQTFYNSIFTQWNKTNPSIALKDVIERGLKLAKDDGILYLGTCGPEYINNEASISYSPDGLVFYRRGIYFCTHAIAYTKWRLRTLWHDLSIYRLSHGESGADTIARQWQALSRTYPISVGVNVHWPPNTGHFGFFYQARGLFASKIQ